MAGNVGWPSPIVGFRVVVASVLAGTKRAVQQGDTIYVSPAMYDLIVHAETHEELKRLLEKIDLLQIPEFDWKFQGVMFGDR